MIDAKIDFVPTTTTTTTFYPEPLSIKNKEKSKKTNDLWNNELPTLSLEDYGISSTALQVIAEEIYFPSNTTKAQLLDDCEDFTGKIIPRSLKFQTPQNKETENKPQSTIDVKPPTQLQTPKPFIVVNSKLPSILSELKTSLSQNNNNNNNIITTPKTSNTNTAISQQTTDLPNFDETAEFSRRTFFPLVREITEAQYKTCPTYLRNQISLDILHESVALINDFVTNKRSDPHRAESNDIYALNYFTDDELAEFLPNGNKAKAIILILLNLKLMKTKFINGKKFMYISSTNNQEPNAIGQH